MLEFASITSFITRHAPKAIEILITQGQKNEAANKVFQELGLNPAQIPDDVDTVYVYALVRYGVFKPEAILNLFREREIKGHFLAAYSSQAPFEFAKKTKEFLNQNQNSALKKQIIDAKINFLGELEEFGEVFIAVAKQTRPPRFQPYPDWNLNVYPEEFKALIFEKTRLFCDRDFVFKAIQEFFKTKPKGYFTVIGDAGMGKSAIAAKYVLATKSPCYFNIFAERRNRPEDFLASIRQQLIKRYSLKNADNADLKTLLQKASEELKGQKLVIVVDALDEVEQEGNSNLLDLPQSLPNGVYFLLTRRPYNQQTKRLTLSPDTPVNELDLREDKYQTSSEKGVKEYLYLFLKMSKEEIRQWIQQLLKNQKEGEIIELNEWRQKQNPPINEEEFVDKLAKKSQNNFMYLRYVLPAIATNQYNDLSLKGLPEGLEQYYITHWQRMGMDNDDNDINVKILFILVVRGDAISSDMIANILVDKDNPDNPTDIFPVEKILGEWVEYVTPKKVQEDGEEKTYYTIYHRSFLEFLQKRPNLDEKKNKNRFKEVNRKIYEYLNG